MRMQRLIGIPALAASVLHSAEIDSKVQQRMESAKIPGVSIAVLKDGRIDWARGCGVTPVVGGYPVNAETLFQAALISKHVAAMVALHLVDEGRLALDEDRNLKLRSWKVPENEFTKTEEVTPRRLPNHSAVLRVRGFRRYAEGHSTFEQPLPALLQSNAASGHNDAGKVIPVRCRTYPEMTAPGLWTTPSDLARIVIEL